MQLCSQSSPATINYVKTPGRNPQERWRDAVDRLVFWVETRGVGPLKKLKPGSPEHARLQPLVNEMARQMGVKPPGLEVVKGSNRSPLFSMERSATLSTRDSKKIAGMSYTLVGDAKFMKRLDSGELKAVVRHELAHMKLNHLGIKRDARGHVVQPPAVNHFRNVMSSKPTQSSLRAD